VTHVSDIIKVGIRTLTMPLFPYTHKELCRHIMWCTNWCTFRAYWQWRQET